MKKALLISFLVFSSLSASVACEKWSEPRGKFRVCIDVQDQNDFKKSKKAQVVNGKIVTGLEYVLNGNIYHVYCKLEHLKTQYNQSLRSIKKGFVNCPPGVIEKITCDDDIKKCVFNG